MCQESTGEARQEGMYGMCKVRKAKGYICGGNKHTVSLNLLEFNGLLFIPTAYLLSIHIQFPGLQKVRFFGQEGL